MKMQGEAVEFVDEVVVIPLGGKEYVFKARPVIDFEPYELLFPRPEVPIKVLPGPKEEPDPDNKDFVKALEDWASNRTAWMFLKSLEATEDLVWETVDMDKPDTWGNFEAELRETGFSDLHVMRIFEIITTACGLNQDKINEATKRFLAAQVQTPNE